MKNSKFAALIFVALLMIFSCSAVYAQEESPTGDAPKRNLNQDRPSLLAELNLTPNQIQQIRRINRENQAIKREAQQRLREAKRSLDQAIYADNADETEIRARLKDAQQAHAEVLKINSATEFAVRRVLTAEQLVKFREVRQIFAEQKEAIQNQRKNNRLNAPNKKLVNRPRRLRNN